MILAQISRLNYPARVRRRLIWACTRRPSSYPRSHVKIVRD